MHLCLASGRIPQPMRPPVQARIAKNTARLRLALPAPCAPGLVAVGIRVPHAPLPVTLGISTANPFRTA
jgi:hypothetical protein